MAGRWNLQDYVDVQERINRFWVEYPDGRIQTELMSLPDDFTQCRFKTSVYKHKDDAHPSATGWAFELAGGAGANSTSHEENCETSSTGRALVNMGYAKNGADRPSRQEMEKVNRGHERPVGQDTRSAAPARDLEVVTREVLASAGIAPGQVAAITRMCAELNMIIDDRVIADFGKGSLAMLTQDEAGQLIGALDAEVRVHRAASRLVTA